MPAPSIKQIASICAVLVLLVLGIASTPGGALAATHAQNPAQSATFIDARNGHAPCVHVLASSGQRGEDNHSSCCYRRPHIPSLSVRSPGPRNVFIDRSAQVDRISFPLNPRSRSEYRRTEIIGRPFKAFFAVTQRMLS